MQDHKNTLDLNNASIGKSRIQESTVDYGNVSGFNKLDEHKKLYFKKIKHNNLQKFKEYKCREQAENASKFIFYIFSNIVNIFSIVLYIIEVNGEAHPGKNSNFIDLIKILDLIGGSYFCVEYVYFLIRSNEQTLKQILSLGSFLDIITLIPSFVSFFVTNHKIRAFFRMIKVFRVIRIHKSIKQGEYDTNLNINILKINHGSIQFLLIGLVFLCCFMISTGLVLGGQDGTTNSFSEPDLDFIDAGYYIIVTTTTLGYGDIYPTNIYSRFLCIFIILTFITIVSNQISWLIRLLNIWGSYTRVKSKNHIICLIDNSVDLYNGLSEIKREKHSQSVVLISREQELIKSNEFPYNKVTVIYSECVDLEVMERANAKNAKCIYIFLQKQFKDCVIGEKVNEFITIKINQYYSNIPIYVQSLTKTNINSTTYNALKVDFFKKNDLKITNVPPLYVLKSIIEAKSMFNPGFATFIQNLLFNNTQMPHDLSGYDLPMQAYFLGCENKIQIKKMPSYFIDKDFHDAMRIIYAKSMNDYIVKIMVKDNREMNRPILLIGIYEDSPYSSNGKIYPKGYIINELTYGIFIVYDENNYGDGVGQTFFGKKKSIDNVEEELQGYTEGARRKADELGGKHKMLEGRRGGILIETNLVHDTIAKFNMINKEFIKKKKTKLLLRLNTNVHSVKGKKKKKKEEIMIVELKNEGNIIREGNEEITKRKKVNEFLDDNDMISGNCNHKDNRSVGNVHGHFSISKTRSENDRANEDKDIQGNSNKKGTLFVAKTLPKPPPPKNENNNNNHNNKENNIIISSVNNNTINIQKSIQGDDSAYQGDVKAKRKGHDEILKHKKTKVTFQPSPTKNEAQRGNSMKNISTCKINDRDSMVINNKTIINEEVPESTNNNNANANDMNPYHKSTLNICSIIPKIENSPTLNIEAEELIGLKDEKKKDNEGMIGEGSTKGRKDLIDEFDKASNNHSEKENSNSIGNNFCDVKGGSPGKDDNSINKMEENGRDEPNGDGKVKWNEEEGNHFNKNGILCKTKPEPNIKCTSNNNSKSNSNTSFHKDKHENNGENDDNIIIIEPKNDYSNHNNKRSKFTNEFSTPEVEARERDYFFHRKNIMGTGKEKFQDKFTGSNGMFLQSLDDNANPEVNAAASLCITEYYRNNQNIIDEENKKTKAFNYSNRIIDCSKTDISSGISNHILLFGYQEGIDSLIQNLTFHGCNIVICIIIPYDFDEKPIGKLLKQFNQLYLIYGNWNNPSHGLNGGLSKAYYSIFLIDSLHEKTNEDMDNILSFKATDFFFQTKTILEMWSHQSIKFLGYRPINPEGAHNEFLHPLYMGGNLIYLNHFDRIISMCHQNSKVIEAWTEGINLGEQFNGGSKNKCNSQVSIVTIDVPKKYEGKEFYDGFSDLLCMKNPIMILGGYIENPIEYGKMRNEGNINKYTSKMTSIKISTSYSRGFSRNYNLHSHGLNYLQLAKKKSINNKIVVNYVDLAHPFFPVFISNPPPWFVGGKKIKMMIGINNKSEDNGYAYFHNNYGTKLGKQMKDDKAKKKKIGDRQEMFYETGNSFKNKITEKYTNTLKKMEKSK